ncbi:MAG: shikimate dehydrogenase [Bacteroidota bacterium]|jgi:shikimate dehydrogenase
MANEPKKRFGLLGRNIAYSFSRTYFGKKFEAELFQDNTYENFDLESLEAFPELIANNPDIKGLNVTIPYKEHILPYLDELSDKAKAIGAVNVIRFKKNGQLKGYNSDWYGFKKALRPLLQKHHTKALILGTGGAAKAVAYALDQMGITYAFVSRSNQPNSIRYEHLNETIFETYSIIINCTPLGTFPDVDRCPPLPYHLFTPQHIAFDLIYNPEKTSFLQQAEIHGARIQNGYTMLVFQAEKAWQIWNR